MLNKSLSNVETYVVCKVDTPTPIAYMNVFDPGDIWVKTKGCDECSEESRLYCCGNCSMLLKDTGECRLHIGFNKREKPFHCIVDPVPNICHSWCCLEYECIQGPHKGKIRRVRDKRDQIISKTT
jgi:hypothetical protein